MTPSETALLYAEDVIEGVINSGQYMKLAAERFIDDLERSAANDFDYYFSPEKADRAIRFMEKMPHTKGKWASKNLRLKLEPWQMFIECNIFGWLRREDDTRRFVESYEEVARKNGKSMRLAARAVYMLTADDEYGAEVYMGATSRKQAEEVFTPAKIMINKLAGLRKRYNLKVGHQNIHSVEDNSKMEPLTGKPGDGQSPSFAVADEFHEHSTWHLYDAMETGMGARDQPLLSIITTAGDNFAGPCYEKRQLCVRILTKQDEEPDENTFVAIFCLDDEDDWDDPENLIKANPNLDVSVKKADLIRKIKNARRSAAKQNVFRTKHCNQWVGARVAWMNMIFWRKAKDESLTLDDFRGMDCHIAVDLASKKDLACYRIVFKVDGVYIGFGRYFICEKAVEENETYQEFRDKGLIIVTPGNATDFAEIEASLIKDCTRFNAISVAFDPFHGPQMMQNCMAEGIECVEFRNTVGNMSNPMKELEARVLDGNYKHSGDEVMTWAIGNVSARKDAKDNIFPRKSDENSEKCKIDPVVSEIMAIGRWINDEPPPKSVYETTSL
jgi:phage terminase large subunit-like protein